MFEVRCPRGPCTCTDLRRLGMKSFMLSVAIGRRNKVLKAGVFADENRRANSRAWHL